MQCGRGQDNVKTATGVGWCEQQSFVPADRHQTSPILATCHRHRSTQAISMPLTSAWCDKGKDNIENVFADSLQTEIGLM